RAAPCCAATPADRSSRRTGRIPRSGVSRANGIKGVRYQLFVSDFDFELPPEQIAQQPRPRGAARLLVVDRAAASWRETTVADLPSLLTRGDLLVVNDTRVFPARLLGRREPSGGAVECLLVEPAGTDRWLALVHPGQKLKPGSRLVFEDPLRAP